MPSLWVGISTKTSRSAVFVVSVSKTEKREIKLEIFGSEERNVMLASESKKRLVTLENGQSKNALKSRSVLENPFDFSMRMLNGGKLGSAGMLQK